MRGLLKQKLCNNLDLLEQEKVMTISLMQKHKKV